ncbi:MAG: peptidoglycan editing factor PgeF [Candidatus Krumholzibacteriota bacterium]|nr:peptidoglycan editing factor PgeF [Candidatus Krumholzibacteriota bacterium]
MPERILGELTLHTYELFDAHTEVTHVITTRHGGVSAEPYDSLNLGLHVGDDESAVLANRERLTAITGVPTDRLTFGGQVHEMNVVVVDASNAGGKFEATDSLVTDTPDTPLIILVADCVVVGLYDPVQRAVGIAHAGWRGTLGAIAQKTVAAMRVTFGTKPGDILAAIGPSIGPCCYEVGAEVVDAFYAEQGDIAPDILATPEFASAGSFEGAINDDRMKLDLWQANALLLEHAGVSASSIEASAVCTSCNTGTYFSHRGEKGNTGRFAGIIQLHDHTQRAY